METRRLLKQRLAVFLSIAMALTMLLGSTPQMQTTAEAATNNIKIEGTNGLGVFTWRNTDKVYYFAVEANQTVPLGSLFYISSNGYFYSYLADAKNVTYSLEKTSAATLSKKGVLKTKSEGTIQGTLKYKNLVQRFAVKILKTGKLGTNGPKYNKIRSIVKKIKNYNGKVTSKNCYQYRNLISQYNDALKDLNSAGIKTGSGSITIDGVTINTARMPYLALPLIAGFDSGADMMWWKYTHDMNPVGTRAGKVFKVKRVSAKKNTKNFTITLEKKPTALQIFAIKNYYSSDSVIKNDKMAMFPIYIKDKKNGCTYHGIAVAREGSKEIKVTMTYMKFKSGHKYQTVSAETLDSWSDWIDWTKKKMVVLR